MDFITTLSRKAHGFNFIWVIVDRLTKSAHFISIVESIFVEKLAKIYIQEVVVRHGLSVVVVSNRDVRFTSRFWRKLHEE